MINNVTLMGRIAQDLELKHTNSGIAVLAFTVAVDRGYKKEGEENRTDFIRCVAWKQTAVFIEKYFEKGSMIGLVGTLQSRTYDDKNGSKHYITEVIAKNASFTGERNNKTVSKSENSIPEEEIGNIEDFEVVITDDGVPF